ncbi:hypothetical protein PPYR_05615 [Photinus pyralis]|uniref:DDE Tnp4 domain-containing protein n=2 Tax=Photinus pyralis TaxID=7054 RepID=A0A5N4AV89_PHOPY|nr:hypothetical protein PPYR_05615 [Photinus pyralis]
MAVNDVNIFSESDSDEELVNYVNILYRRPYVVRQRPDHLQFWDDVDFINRFRLSKETVQELLVNIENIIQEECMIIQQGFYRIAAFPRVLLALDCTHVKIQSPGGAQAEQFRNRKGYFSMNIQAACDHNLKFRNIVARWPGATHDSTIFNNSMLKAVFEDGMGNHLILGDSGYPLIKYLITPLLNPTTPGENRFNEAQIRTRNVIERAFGVWKRRFPVLALGLRLQLPTVQDIIMATAILHNIAIVNNEPEVLVDEEVAQLIENVIPAENNNDIENESTRNELIHYFNRIMMDSHCNLIKSPLLAERFVIFSIASFLVAHILFFLGLLETGFRRLDGFHFAQFVSTVGSVVDVDGSSTATKFCEVLATDGIGGSSVNCMANLNPEPALNIEKCADHQEAEMNWLIELEEEDNNPNETTSNNNKSDIEKRNEEFRNNLKLSANTFNIKHRAS